MLFYIARKVWRYQWCNHNPSVLDGQTIQWLNDNMTNNGPQNTEHKSKNWTNNTNLSKITRWTIISCKPWKWAVMYLCVKGVEFASFNDFSICLYNRSDSVWYFFFFSFWFVILCLKIPATFYNDIAQSVSVVVWKVSDWDLAISDWISVLQDDDGLNK
jgi:hypothetical protein